MNNLAAEHFQAECPLPKCRWASEPLAHEQAAREARRRHLSDHAHGDMVDFLCHLFDKVTVYEKRE